uniref:Tax protein n=1 Tax=Haemonchus placei TaxID=6290 RepID=A0A0N4VSX1_HAEPC
LPVPVTPFFHRSTPSFDSHKSLSPPNPPSVSPTLSSHPVG